MSVFRPTVYTVYCLRVKIAHSWIAMDSKAVFETLQHLGHQSWLVVHLANGITNWLLQVANILWLSCKHELFHIYIHTFHKSTCKNQIQSGERGGYWVGTFDQSIGVQTYGRAIDAPIARNEGVHRPAWIEAVSSLTGQQHWPQKTLQHSPINPLWWTRETRKPQTFAD